MKILREFNYRDETGKVIYQKIRTDDPDKKFQRRRPDGNGGFIYDWKNVHLVPYNLHKLKNCNDFVCITAGERDADTLTELGHIATTDPGSESAELVNIADFLHSTCRGVFVFSDQDKTGKECAERRARQFYGRVPFVKIINVPKGKDVLEYLEGMNKREAQRAVTQLIAEAPEYQPASESPNEKSIRTLDEIYNDDTFIESASGFLSKEDEAQTYIIPEIVPAGKLITFSGHPRAMKTLGADEIMIAAATGTAAFSLARFQTARKFRVWRIAQEDPARDERERIKGLLASRGISEFPDTLLFSIHKAIDLDDSVMQERIIRAIRKHGIDLVVIDPIRRFSAKVDKGPADVRELTGYLRRVVIETGATVVIIHHFVKENASKSDDRRRAHRTSGGDWFAAVECPIFFEKIADDKTLVVPEDFKFSHDPAGFTFRFVMSDDGSITLAGETEREKDSRAIAVDSKILEFLRENPRQSGNQIRQRLRLKTETCNERLDHLHCTQVLDFQQGPRRSKLWYLRGEV